MQTARSLTKSGKEQGSRHKAALPPSLFPYVCDFFFFRKPWSLGKYFPQDVVKLCLHSTLFSIDSDWKHNEVFSMGDWRGGGKERNIIRRFVSAVGSRAAVAF